MNARLGATIGSLCVGVFIACVPHRASLGAQEWITRQQQALWLGAFVDQGVTDKVALWFDGQWRRMDFGAEPQQLLLRPGVQVTLAPGVRVASGYAYIATQPYGRLPIANPTREHRTWQQLVLTHRGGALSFTHRYRWEQRWIAPLREEGAGDRELAPFSYAQRARYMVRAQGNLPGLTVGGRSVIGFVWDELLMPVGHGNASVSLTQNRASLGVGVPIDARQRIEVNYMNLWNGFAARRANEVNHTLSVSWVWAAPR